MHKSFLLSPLRDRSLRPSLRKRVLRRRIRSLRRVHKRRESFSASLIRLAAETARRKRTNAQPRLEDKEGGLSVDAATASGSSLSPLTPRGRVAALVPSKSPSSSDNDVRAALNTDPDVTESLEVAKANELCLPLSEELQTEGLKYWDQRAAQGVPHGAPHSVSFAELAPLYDTKRLLNRSKQEEDPVWTCFSQNLANGVSMGPRGMPSLASILEIQSSKDDASLSECLREFQSILFPDGYPDQSLVPYERTLRQFASVTPRPRPPSLEEITDDPELSDAPSETLEHPNLQEMQRDEGRDQELDDVQYGKEFRLLSMRDCGCPCSRRLRSLYQEHSHTAAKPC